MEKLIESDKKLIEPEQGYSPQIGILVSMLNEARLTTLKISKRLSQEELDTHLDAEANSIGTLLFHIASSEYVYQVKMLEGQRPLTEFEVKKWENGFPGNLINRKVSGHSLEYYWDELKKVREGTLRLLKDKDDKWLYETSTYAKSLVMSNYYMYFHFLQDEVSHQGQMKWIRKRIQKDWR